MAGSKRSAAKVAAARNLKARHMASLQRALGDAWGLGTDSPPVVEEAQIAYLETHATVFAVLKGRQDDYNADDELSHGVRARCRVIRTKRGQG